MSKKPHKGWYWCFTCQRHHKKDTLKVMGTRYLCPKCNSLMCKYDPKTAYKHLAQKRIPDLIIP